MGSRRDDYLTRDPMRSGVKPTGPSLGDVLTKRPEPTRGRKAVAPDVSKPMPQPKRK